MWHFCVCPTLQVASEVSSLHKQEWLKGRVPTQAYVLVPVVVAVDLSERHLYLVLMQHG